MELEFPTNSKTLKNYFRSKLLLLFSSPYLTFLLNFLLFLLRLLLTSRPKPLQFSDSDPNSTTPARALSHVLLCLSTVPASSRKYATLRDLADRLLSDNLRHGDGLVEVSRVALSVAFARALRRLRARREWTVRRLWEEEGDGDVEKTVAEAIWLAEKMRECGGVAEAVRMWAVEKEVAAVAVAAEPRLQAGFVRLSAFLFRHAEDVEGKTGEKEDQTAEAGDYQTSMLVSWMPLLCRATNGTDAPVLSSAERADTVKVLEHMIMKMLNREQQEEVLKLWLHHYAACPDSDWPNLQSCFIQWYDQSRNQLVHYLH